MNVQHNDVVKQSIFDALRAAGEVKDEMEACLTSQLLSGTVAQDARRLLRDIDRSTIFGKTAIREFREISECLAPMISHESRSAFVDVDGCVSGGYLETRYTEQGECLTALQSAIDALVTRLQSVLHRVEAELIAAELRE